MNVQRAGMCRGAALSWLFLCLGCGAHSRSIPSDDAHETGGADSVGLGGAGGEGDPLANGGASGGAIGEGDPVTSGGVSAGVGSAAGAGASVQSAPGGDAGAVGYVPHIDSGTRRCENADYCFGLACYAPASFQPTVCVKRCDTDADCEPFEACVQSEKLEGTCYARCDSPSACAYQFDCFDFSGQGQLVCFPAEWAGRRKELGN